MLTRVVVDRRAPRGEGERGVDGNKVGLGLGYPLEDFFVGEGDVRLRRQAAEDADTRRPAGGTGEVDAGYDEGLVMRHGESLRRLNCWRVSGLTAPPNGSMLASALIINYSLLFNYLCGTVKNFADYEHN
jgi:hypothetical protein